MAKKISPKSNKKKVAEKSTKVTVKKHISKELFWIMGVMIILLIIFAVFYYIFYSFTHFNYQGLAFTKEKYGQIPVYHYYYYFTNPNGQLVKYNLFLRNDPRKNTIPVNDTISLIAGRRTFVSVNTTGLDKCNSSSISVATLAKFLLDNGIPVRGASPDYKLANESGIIHATCELYPSNVIILLEAGNQTQIIKQKPNCYSITISNCEIEQAVEKFEVQSVLDAKAREKGRESGIYALNSTQ
ncbi:MAG: hypothetical protein Q7S74_01055 [Nanoarchaeota archaeon]|nr:hypothetical protein [Nanoarchaeota archaeon]